MLEVDSLRITEVGTAVAAGLERQTQKEIHMENLIKDSLRITEVGTSVAAGLERQTQKEAHMENLIKVKPMRRDKKILLVGASLLVSSLVPPWMYNTL